MIMNRDLNSVAQRQNKESEEALLGWADVGSSRRYVSTLQEPDRKGVMAAGLSHTDPVLKTSLRE